MIECGQVARPISDVGASIDKLGKEIEITRDLFHKLKAGLESVLSPELERPARGPVSGESPRCGLSSTITEITYIVCDLQERVSDALERLQL